MSDDPYNLEIATRALRCLDLTDLTETCTDQSVDALCAKAIDPRGPAAAVCIWPQFVSRAKSVLKGSPVRIATVVNFPSGDEEIGRVMDDTDEALEDGANEIDLVLPYKALRSGERGQALDMVVAIRDRVDQNRILKVILETGELKDPDLIKAAALLSIEGGADFIKTSTGKTPVSATLEAAEIMLRTILATDHSVGLKPSGGIRTAQDAALYFNLADRIMGEDWATPRTFRLGASGLYDALIGALQGQAVAPGSGHY